MEGDGEIEGGQDGRKEEGEVWQEGKMGRKREMVGREETEEGKKWEWFFS